MARRIAGTLRYTRTAEIQAAAMRDLGYSPARIRKEAMKILNADKNYRQTVAKNTLEYKKDIKQLIEDITKRAYLEGDMLIAAAGRMAWVDDLSIWKSAGKFLKGKSFLSQLVNAMAEQTRGELKNLTRTTAFRTQSGMESIKNLYQNELDKATIKICSGTFSQEKVMNDLIHELSQSGLRTVNFDTGRSMQLDTAAKLAVRTGCHQLSGKVHNQNMKDTGCNLMYVAEHEGARNVGTGIANHEEWQGKIYYVKPGKDYSEEASRVGQDQIRDIWEETGYSPDGAYVNDPRGLYGYNCRHTCYVWFEGISEKPEPIKKIEPISYKGKTYDRYAVTQKMRAMERGIRALKREKAALTSLGMDTKGISVKIKEHIFEYGKFCDAAKVPHSKYNIRYDGSSGDLTKTKAYQRYHNMVEDSKIDTELPKEILDKNNESSNIILSGGISGARNPYSKEAADHAQRYYGLVRSMKTDVVRISKTTGMSEDSIKSVKNFIFYEKHELGGEEPELFEPDYMMAESWRRLVEGKPEPHDITMIKHELLEQELMQSGMTQYEAHNKASQTYNYSKEAEEYHGNIEKHKKR